MKSLYYILPTALLGTTCISQAVTTSANINRYASNSIVQDYTFTEPGVGSITLRTTMQATRNGTPSGTLTNLDGNLRVGNSADGDNTRFMNNGGGEGFSFTVSLLSATPKVDTSTIQFRVNSIGLRTTTSGWPTVSPHYTWTSPSTNRLNSLSQTSQEALNPADQADYGSLSTADYTASFNLPTANHSLQLTDNVPGNRGLIMTATFVETQSVPEPSSTALLGLAGLALILRRRK